MREGALIGEAFNFGLDRPLTALEVVEKIIALSPFPDIDPIIQDEAPNEIHDQFLNSEKAWRVLHWKASHTIEEGLQQTIRWYANHLGLPSSPSR